MRASITFGVCTPRRCLEARLLLRAGNGVEAPGRAGEDCSIPAAVVVGARRVVAGKELEVIPQDLFAEVLNRNVGIPRE